MPGTMKEADLVSDFKASLNDAASSFTSVDFQRHLAAAALDFRGKRPRTIVGALNLLADQAQYDAPVDLIAVKSHLWGIAPRQASKPWENTWTGRLPDLKLVETGASPIVRKLQLDPPPRAGQISVLGAELRYYYYARHVIGAEANQTSISEGDRGLLILRAQAEAMRELAMRGVKKPVELRAGLGAATARNGTPAAVYQALLDEFREAA